jgi:hypothetical protein
MRNGRKISKKPVSILLFLCVLVLIPATIARPQEKPLLVAIEVMAPCVMKSDEAYTGFEIELWDEISKDLGLEFAYYETNMDGIFTDLIEGKAHVGFSCITITHAREERVDFSHHTLDSGLRILVLNKKEFSLIGPVKSLFSPLVMKALAYLGLFLIVCGHVFWWVEKGKHLISVNYFPGIFQGTPQVGWPCYGVSCYADRDRLFRVGCRSIIVGHYFAKTAFRYHPPTGPSQQNGCNGCWHHKCRCP